MTSQYPPQGKIHLPHGYQLTEFNPLLRSLESFEGGVQQMPSLCKVPFAPLLSATTLEVI